MVGGLGVSQAALVRVKRDVRCRSLKKTDVRTMISKREVDRPAVWASSKPMQRPRRYIARSSGLLLGASLAMLSACGDDDDDDDDGDESGSTGTSSTSTSTSSGTSTSTSTATSSSTSGVATSGTTSTDTDADSESDSTSGSGSGSETESTGSASDASDGVSEESSGSTSIVDTSSGTGAELPVICTDVEIDIPGYFPEGISVDSIGQLYIGSIGTQQVVRRQACSSAPEDIEIFVQDDTLGNVIGVLVDEAAEMLWVCNSDSGTYENASIRGYSLDDATLTVEHAFGDPGNPGFCNDLALDGDGNLYATDSAAGRIIRVHQADLLVANSAVEWADDPAFDISGTFSINGIAYDGASSLYTVKSEGGLLFRIDIEESDPTITQLTLNRTIEGGDGLEWMGDNQLLVNENAIGRVSVITVDGDSATLETLYDDLTDQPTTSVLVQGTWFIVQSQLDALDSGPGETPFMVVTRPAPAD